MNTVGQSLQHIIQIPALSTSQTSNQIFNRSINGILVAVENLINNGVPLNPHADLVRNAQNARFSFDTLHHRIQLR